MALFKDFQDALTMIDFKHLKCSVDNLTDLIDKMSTRMDDLIKVKGERKSSHDLMNRNTEPIDVVTAKPKGKGFDVRFCQSQEDIVNTVSITPSLTPHLSLPNLRKIESVTWRDPCEEISDKMKPSNGRNDGAKNNYRDKEKPLLNITSDSVAEWILMSSKRRPNFEDSGDVHPIDFLDDLKDFIGEMKLPESKKLTFAISCLDGKPLMWARCFKSEMVSIEDFCKYFKEEFWGHNQQKAVLFEMKLGKYNDAKAKMSMTEYFLRSVSYFRHLEPPPTDLEIIYSMSAHFPQPIEMEMRLLQKPSLREAYRLLKCREEGIDEEFVPNYLFEMCEAFHRQRTEEGSVTK